MPRRGGGRHQNREGREGGGGGRERNFNDDWQGDRPQNNNRGGGGDKQDKSDKRSSYQYRQGLHFVDQVPDFLKGMIKPVRRPGEEDDEERQHKPAGPHGMPLEGNEDERDWPEKDDEAPTVVVLGDGDLSKDEVNKLREAGAKIDAAKGGKPKIVPIVPSKSGVVFQKPTNTSSKRPDNDDAASSNSSAAQKIKKPKLLSFNLEDP